MPRSKLLLIGLLFVTGSAYADCLDDLQKAYEEKLEDESSQVKFTFDSRERCMEIMVETHALYTTKKSPGDSFAYDCVHHETAEKVWESGYIFNSTQLCDEAKACYEKLKSNKGDAIRAYRTLPYFIDTKTMNAGAGLLNCSHQAPKKSIQEAVAPKAAADSSSADHPFSELQQQGQN